MTRSKTLTLLALAGALAGCSRPTQQESTYRLNLENKFSWQGPGPDIRWYWPWYTMHVVSHQQEIQTFPLIQGENARIPQIELEKLQSIITADGQIMIQEMSITIYKKADPTAVERYYIQHRKTTGKTWRSISTALSALTCRRRPRRTLNRTSLSLAWRSGTTSRASVQ